MIQLATNLPPAPLVANELLARSKLREIWPVRLAEIPHLAIFTGFHRPIIPRARAGDNTLASVAQLAEQLICNQQVVGSSPSASSLCRQNRTTFFRHLGGNPVPFGWKIAWIWLGGFPSGQRGQTVNLMAMPSQVRILHPPLN